MSALVSIYFLRTFFLSAPPAPFDHHNVKYDKNDYFAVPGTYGPFHNFRDKLLEGKSCYIVRLF